MQSKFGRSLLIGIVLSASSVSACAGQAPERENPEERARRLLAEPNPLPASDSPWIEELTYMEVRDRIAAGATTAIVPTGGIEENGPYLATGKHNYILEAMCPVIVGKLGNALCAPIVPFVPEGNIDPPDGAMRFPGSFSVRDATYIALLEDIGASLRQHGFRDIVFIGDSGGNQDGMRKAADSLNERWRGGGVRAHFIEAFYTPGWEETENYTEEVLGVKEGDSDGHHDDIWVTAMMMVTDPETVRHRQRVQAGLASINGVDIADADAAIELGRRMIDFRASYTVDAIEKAIAAE